MADQRLSARRKRSPTCARQRPPRASFEPAITWCCAAYRSHAQKLSGAFRCRRRAHALTDCFARHCGAGDAGAFSAIDPQRGRPHTSSSARGEAGAPTRRTHRQYRHHRDRRAPRVGPHRAALSRIGRMLAIAPGAFDQGSVTDSASWPRGRYRRNCHRRRGCPAVAGMVAGRFQALAAPCRRLPRKENHARHRRILHRRHDRRSANRHLRLVRCRRPRLRHLFQRSQDGDAWRFQSDARRPWRGVARDST